MSAPTAAQVAIAADRLENLQGDRRAAALRMVPAVALEALVDELVDRVDGDRGSDKAIEAHEAALAEAGRRAAIRAENEAIANAKAARRELLDKVAATFAKGVEVFVPGHADVKGELFCTGRRKAADVVDLSPYGARDGWTYHDGWDVVWGDRHNRRQVWFSNDQIAAAQIDGEEP